MLSQAIVANNTVYCSGAVGVDPSTGKIVEGTVADRTVRSFHQAPTTPHPIEITNTKPKLTIPLQHQCIQNLSAILTAAGTSLEHVLKVNVFLSDMSLFTPMNDVYKTYWGAVKPARTCVAVKQLPLGTDVEIECMAVVP